MKELSLNLYTWIALILLLIGGVTWGLFGIFNANLITGIFGELLGRLILICIGVAAGYICYLIYKSKMQA